MLPFGLGAPFSLSAAVAMGPRTRVPLRLDVRLGGLAHRTWDVDLTVGRFFPGTFEWTYVQPAGTYIVEVLPVVVQLTDDDGDGAITKCDIPDVVARYGPWTTHDCYVSGAARMVRSTLRVLAADDVPPPRIRYDTFGDL